MVTPERLRDAMEGARDCARIAGFGMGLSLFIAPGGSSARPDGGPGDRFGVSSSIFEDCTGDLASSMAELFDDLCDALRRTRDSLTDDVATWLRAHASPRAHLDACGFAYAIWKLICERDEVLCERPQESELLSLEILYPNMRSLPRGGDALGTSRTWLDGAARRVIGSHPEEGGMSDPFRCSEEDLGRVMESFGESLRAIAAYAAKLDGFDVFELEERIAREHACANVALKRVFDPGEQTESASNPADSRDSTSRIVFDPDGKTITLDGKAMQIEDKRRFRLYREIVKANGRPIVVSENGFPQTKRDFYDPLPEPIKQTISSKRSHGGGYFLIDPFVRPPDPDTSQDVG